MDKKKKRPKHRGIIKEDLPIHRKEEHEKCSLVIRKM